jgi:hypothetical protein
MKDVDFYHHIDQLVGQGYTILPPQLTETECDDAQRQLDRLHVEHERGGLELIFNKAQIFERHWTRCEYEMAEVVKPEVLERAGDARVVFGLDAQAPYVERWQWDREEGRPTADFSHLGHRGGS